MSSTAKYSHEHRAPHLLDSLQARGAEVYSEQVYAAWPSISGLAGVSERQLKRWIATSQLGYFVTVHPNYPRRSIRLYRLVDVLVLRGERDDDG